MDIKIVSGGQTGVDQGVRFDVLLTPLLGV